VAVLSGARGVAADELAMAHEVDQWEVVERSCLDAQGVVTHCDEELLLEEAILSEIEQQESLSADANARQSTSSEAALAATSPPKPEPARSFSPLVDVYLLGRVITTTRITHDAKSLTFESPELVLDGLTGIRQYERVATYLQQPLAVNAELVCTPWREKHDCGWVDTDTAAVIFDENRLRVDLFLAPEFLTYKARFRNKYLPQARRQKTSVMSTNLVATRLDEEDTSLYATARGIFSYGHGNLSMDGDYNSDTEEPYLRTLSLTHYFPDHELQAGTFTYSPAGYLANLDVMGVRWHSSLKSRRDVASLIGSELEVFLPQRSIVQLAVGDRVYSGGSYEAGNHSLDTSMLPEGTYEVEIRINDPVAGDRVEKRLFTRSKLLPPSGQGSYGFMLGSPVDEANSERYPKRENEAVFGADYGQRLNGRMAWNLGFLQLRDDALFQAELIRFSRYMLWKVRALAGESDTYGMGLSLGYKNAFANASLSADHYNSGIVFEALDSSALSDLLSTRFTQVSAAVVVKSDGVEYGLNSSYRNQTEDAVNKESNQLAAYVRNTLFERGGFKGTLESRYQRDDIEEKLVFKLQVAFGRGQWSSKAHSYAGLDDSGEHSYNSGVTAKYKSGDLSSDSYWENSVFVSDNQDLSQFGGKLGFQNRHFYTTAATEWTDRDSGDNLHRSVASLGAQIGLDERGLVAGGMTYTGTGAIIDVAGEPEGARFDVFANGKRVRSGRVGSRHFVSLKPFKAYSLKLVPQSTEYNGFDRREYEFALWPGNVERIETHTVPRYRLVTTVVDQQGRHIEAGTILHGGDSLDMGEGGVVTVQVAPGDVLRITPTEADSCMVVAPNAREKEVLISRRPLVCFDDPQY
jgi:hypothetical protein